MKKILVVFIAFLASFNLKSQVEIATNPVLLLFEAGILSVDYNVNDDWGVGADLLFAQGGGWVYLNGKHYFNPRKGNDRFMLGTFTGFVGEFGDDMGFGLGFFGGYKWVSRRNITFELAFGAGRNFSDNDFVDFLPYGKFNVGYRFREKDKTKETKKKKRRR